MCVATQHPVTMKMCEHCPFIVCVGVFFLLFAIFSNYTEKRVTALRERLGWIKFPKASYEYGGIIVSVRHKFKFVGRERKQNKITRTILMGKLSVLYAYAKDEHRQCLLW